MVAAPVHLHPAGRLVALLGNPNCGKTALFNLLTGARQKVANYAGVTVERKEGRFTGASGRTLRVLDLPGTYGLYPRTPDERVTCEVLRGEARGEMRPDLVVCVMDATKLRRSLRLALAARRLGLPCVAALNMADVAERRGIRIDLDVLADALGMPVVATVGVKAKGDQALRAILDEPTTWHRPALPAAGPSEAGQDAARIHEILRRLRLESLDVHDSSERIDRFALHPFVGPAILALILFLVFQAVYAWAQAPMEAIESATAWVGGHLSAALPAGWIRSLAVDGVIAGVGGVLVFLPQIAILFFFILVLEESGYLPRAAYLLDRLMAGVGLSGRSFIPLLSCFACAVPGIMATRTIADARDRRVTILIAPLMTCSARLPVYALLIGAFIPRSQVAGGVELQGLVLFGLYAAGIAGALVVAWILKRFTAGGRQPRPLMMELPDYHWPAVRHVAIGLLQRVKIFLARVGRIILALSVLIWFLASFPAPPPGAAGAAIEHSFAGMLGRALATVFEPVGFNWQISVALVPGIAAREVAVSALGTVYALSAAGEDTAGALMPLLAQDWSLATALALLAWYVFAPQCVATLAAVRRETGSWRMPAMMLAYLFALAYAAAFVTYRVALLLAA